MRAIVAHVAKCTGSVRGNPEVSAVNICPIALVAAPHAGPSISVAKYAGKESNAMLPMTLIFAPITHSAMKIAAITSLFIGFMIFSPHLRSCQKNKAHI